MERGASRVTLVPVCMTSEPYWEVCVCKGRGEGRGCVWEGSGVINMCINKERSDSHISEFKPPSPTWEVSLDSGGILCGGGGRGGEERTRERGNRRRKVRWNKGKWVEIEGGRMWGGGEGREGGRERRKEGEEEGAPGQQSEVVTSFLCPVSFLNSSRQLPRKELKTGNVARIKRQDPSCVPRSVLVR